MGKASKYNLKIIAQGIMALLCLLLVAVSLVWAQGLTISSGQSLNLATSDLTITGSITINGSLQVSSGLISLNGNWANTGTFAAGTGTVWFNGTNQTVSGPTSFYNFKKVESTDDSTDSVLTFEASKTQTVQGTLRLDGLDDNDRINLISSSGGVAAIIKFTGTTALIDYVDVTDSDVNDNGNNIKTTNSLKETNVDFQGPDAHWIFGPLRGAVMMVD